MDEDERERLLNAEANALWEKLRVFHPSQRLFMLADIKNRVARKLRSRESSRYSIDFTADEPPTDPSIPVKTPREENDRVTRAINIADLERLKKETEK